MKTKRESKIQNALNKVDKIENVAKKASVFLKSKRGIKFLNSLHKDRLDVLCKRYNAQFLLLGKSFTKTYNIIKHVTKVENIEPKPCIKTAENKQLQFTKIKPKPFKIVRKSKSTKLTRTQLMHGYEMHKIAKWEKKNPNPVIKSNPSLFDEDLEKEWNNKRNIAVERIRDMIVSRYDKLPLYAKFAGSKGYDKKIAMIRDIDGTGHRINNVNIKDSKTLQLAQKVTNQVYATNPKLVAIQVMDHLRKRGRLILPKVA